MQEKWWQKSVVYQIYPKSFYDSNGDGIGDINGIRSKLWYLKKLGIDVIWLSPTYPSPNADNGYDVSDYYGVSSDYGTIDDMKALIQECTENGIKIIMDLVVNHTSDEHPWFIDAKKSKNSAYRDYYIWRKGTKDNPPNDLVAAFGGSAWEYSKETGEYYLHLFDKKQPDLNWENDKMRKDIWKMMNYWIDMGISGFRMDVIDLLGKIPDKKIKENGPLLHKYIQEMNRETFGKKDLLTVGECWGADPEIGQLYSNPARNELSMIFQFEHSQLDEISEGSKWDLKTLNLKELKSVFSKWQCEMDGKGWNSLFWNNHDLPRIVSRWGNDKDYHVESAKMLALLLHGMKGTPYIYQGEEIGMTNMSFTDISDFNDVEAINMYNERKKAGYSKTDIMKSLRAKARDNARTPMQWDDSYQAGFTTGTPWYKVNPNYTQINAENALNDENSIFYFYQKLIKLRKEQPILVNGNYELIDFDNENIFAYTRKLNKQKWLIVCNFYETVAEFSYPATGRAILSNYEQKSVQSLDSLKLKPYEATIFEL